MSIIEDQHLKTEDTRFADLKKLKKSMRAFEGKQQDNTGVYMRELTDQEALKLWKALTLALVRSYVSMIQKTKELQSKI